MLPKVSHVLKILMNNKNIHVDQGQSSYSALVKTHLLGSTLDYFSMRGPSLNCVRLTLHADFGQSSIRPQAWRDTVNRQIYTKLIINIVQKYYQ